MRSLYAYSIRNILRVKSYEAYNFDETNKNIATLHWKLLVQNSFLQNRYVNKQKDRKQHHVNPARPRTRTFRFGVLDYHVSFMKLS